jgi:hypothetical protein
LPPDLKGFDWLQKIDWSRPVANINLTSFNLWLAGAAVIVVISLGRFVAGPLTGDDDYILHNLASSSLHDVLFAYNVDLVKGEGGETTWYEGFDAIQRRYVRIVPSSMMAIEYRIFGSNPIGLKSVSLFLHLVNIVVGYRLLRRITTDSQSAAIIVTLIGLHPAAAECIGWFACQPILLVTLFSLLSVEALLKLRERVTIEQRVVFVTTATATLFTYEAAIAVPLLLVGIDWLWPRDEALRPTDRWATWSVLAMYPVYIAVALWNRAGVTLSDASYRAGLGEALVNIRVDLANYLVKVLPMPPYGGDTYTAIGSWTGAALLLVVAFFWLARTKRSRARTIGLLVFAVLLAPPLLTRATVSVLNFPSFRQLYLPLTGIAILLCAWRSTGFSRWGLWVARLVVVALVCLYQVMAPAMVDTQARAAQREAGVRLQGYLEGVDAGVPVVQIGQSSCGYSLLYDANGREVWKLIPPTTDGGLPLLRALDEKTLEVRAPEGKMLAILTSVPPDPRPRRSRVVPALLTNGIQRLDFATAYALHPSASAVSGFRLVFDRPLTHYFFIRVSGCADLERWRP